MLTKRQKVIAIKDVKLHDTDTGSAESQIALLTKKIEEVTSHLKTHKKDNHSRKGLIQMVANRRKHIKYLEKNKPESLKKISKKLGIRA